MNNLPSIVVPEGFGRAAEKLADTIRHVVDVAVGPDRVRARAQAHADSAIILAKGRAQIQDIEARAVERLRKREARRQSNIETITLKAVEELPPPAEISQEPVSEDWTSRFFEECQDISDDQMQQIWARILAGEVTRPGSFAPRTLSVVRDLTKDDANLFAKLCEFVWLVPGAGFVPVILDYRAPHIIAADLHFAALTHLTSIGLIEYNAMGYKIEDPLTEIAPLYYDAAVPLKSDGEQARIFKLGHVVLTAVGQELLKIANAEGNDACRKATLEKWSQEGWKEAGLSEPEEGQPASS